MDAVATSHGQRDSGLFEVNFHDDRYLPFEGQGAISSWHLSMPRDCNAFDFESVTDVVLHLNYTARDGGVPLRDAARAAAVTPVREGRRRLFSARQEYPDAWYRFLRPAPDADRQRLVLGLTADRFPYQLRGRAILVTGVRIFLQLADGTKYPDTGSPLRVELTAPGDPAATASTLTAVPSVLDSMPFAVVDRSGQPAKPGEWLIEVAQAEVAKLAAGLRTAVLSGATSHPRLNPEVVHDVLVVLEYTA